MRRNGDWERHPFFVVPVRPGTEQSYRRSNLWLIAALIFVVLGVFAMTMTPELAATAAGAHKPPVKVQPGNPCTT